MVKDYQSKKEYLVLSMVRKYPLYSLNKLAQELPGISRHSIQRILEKNDLSRVEKRLAFSEEKKGRVVSLLERLKIELSFFPQKLPNLEELKKLFERFQEEPWARWQLLRNLVVLTGLVFIFWFGVNFVFAKTPDISLEQPPLDFVNQGEKLFIIGKVVPANSQVTINGNEVSLDGDGSFTAVVDIPMGESVLEIEAIYRRKIARLLRLVKRTPTQEEIQAQEEEEAKKKQEVLDKAAELDRTVKDLMAAKSVVMSPEGEKKGFLRVLNNQIKEEAGLATVVGEVVNLGEEAVSWVMVTANFFDQAGNKVDQKIGFATDFGEVVKPGEIAEFETQVTQKEFDYYSLELSWEEGAVAGIATESAKEKEIVE